MLKQQQMGIIQYCSNVEMQELCHTQQWIREEHIYPIISKINIREGATTCFIHTSQPVTIGDIL